MIKKALFRGALSLSWLLLSACAVQRQYNPDWNTPRGNFQRTAAVPDAPHPPLQQKWTFETKGRIVYAPTVYQGTVYLASRDSELYALRLSDGAQIWKQDLDQGGLFQSPTATAETLFGGKWTPFYTVSAWKREDGSLLWSHQTGDLVNRPPWVLVDETQIYTHVDPALGTPVEVRVLATAWDRQDQHKVWETPLKGIPTVAPALTDELYLLATDDERIQALDKATGEVRWSVPLSGKPVSAPLIHQGKVLVATEAGFVYALALTDGKTVWRYQFPHAHLSGDLALEGRTLFVPAERYLFSFDLVNLEPGWKFLAPNTITAPVVSQDQVYLGCANRMLYVLDRQQGYVAGLYRTGGEILAAPVAAGGLILVGSVDGKLYAFEERPVEKQPAGRDLNQRL